MKNRYINADYYMMRSPIKSTTFAEKYNNIEESFDAIKKDKIFNEQLLIASPSLYKMIQESNIDDLPLKKKKQLISSILSYQNRAAYRTTPFGLFTGVEIKSINELYKDTSNNLSINKHCRVDIEWLLSFVKNIESKYTNILEYKVNSACCHFGNRVYIPYNTDSDARISILCSKPFKIIESICKNDLVSYRDIISNLKEEYPDRDLEVFNQYLNSLIEKEFLISELRPPLCNTNELNYVTNIIKNYSELSDIYLKDLEIINELINDYKVTKLGEGIDIYKELCRKMKSMFEYDKNNLLQVDCEFKNLKNIVDRNDTREISKFVNYLFSLISVENPNDSLNDYKLKFAEKYGEYIEVPIFELLDESVGIGAPRGYSNPENQFDNDSKSSKFNQKLKEYFLEKYSQAIKSNSYIQLDDDEISFLEDKFEYDKFPESLELNFIVKYINDKKVFYLGPNVGSIMAGKTFGRFSYMSDKHSGVLNNIKNALDKNKEDNLSDEVKCELSFVPSMVKAGNVIRNNTSYAKNICCYTNSYDTDNEIKVDDILVGYDNDKFYIRDSKSGKKIKVFMTNMLNVSSLPNVLRFLIDISYDDKFILGTFPWEKYYEDFTYIPEIRYKDIVVSNEKWKISNYGLNIKNKNDYDEFFSKFINVKEKLCIPDKVYYTISDNRLLMDLKQEKYIKLLFDYYKKRLYIELEKAVDKGYISYGENEERNAEVVIPFIKNKKEKNTEIYYKDINKNITKNQVVFFPFDKWLYFKLYGPLDRQNELIEELYYFTNSSSEIGEFYFMRYVDPKPHIRLRFKGDKERLNSILNQINTFAQYLKEEKLISNLVIDTYMPEVERYGGIKLMKCAEKIFYKDSKIVMESIAKLDVEDEKIKYGVISVLHYLDSFNLSFEKQYEFLSNSFVSNEYLQDFKKVKNEYIHDCDSYNGWENLKENSSYAEFLKLLRGREESIFKYCLEVSKTSNLTNEYDDILGSIIHLHCNRFFGIDRTIERKILNFACRVLHGQKYLRKQKEDKCLI